MRRLGVAGLVLSAVLGVGACGDGNGNGSDNGDQASGDAATADERAGADDREGDVDDDGEGPDDDGRDDDRSGNDDDDTGDDIDDAEDAGAEGDRDGAGDDDPTDDADGEPTGAEICRRLPADRAATALGVPAVTASPGTSGTPQCSYAFTGADGVDTDVTVAVLRTAEDLGGRTGAGAYAWVVDLNVQAASGAVTETPLDVGDEAVVLTGTSLHLAVVRYGDRIVTVLARIAAIGGHAVTRLAESTAVLAS